MVGSDASKASNGFALKACVERCKGINVRALVCLCLCARVLLCFCVCELMRLYANVLVCSRACILVSF